PPIAPRLVRTTGTGLLCGTALMLVTITFSSAGQAQVITATWTGASGNWTNPALWSTNPNFPNTGNPPGATYDATVNGAGTLTLDAPIAVRGLTLQAGTVTGANGLTLSGPLNWSGGTLGGTGPTAAGGGLVLSGAGTKTLDGRALTVGGSASTWSGTLTMQNGAVLTNAAGSTITGVFSAGGGVGAQPQFLNNGTFQGDVFAYAARLVNNVIVTGTLTTANATLNAGSRVGRLSLDG